MSTRHERAADKAQNETHQQMLRDMLQRPDNKICADCRKKDPRWVSWNLGVFVCIRCSGIHRSMGTHISKVKSVDLDTWTPEQIANVQRWGNATANKYWEANLTREPTESTIEQWIRAKYERKQFAMPGPIPVPEQLSGAPVAKQQQQQQWKQQQHQSLQAPARVTPVPTPDFGPRGSPASSSRPTSGGGELFAISGPPRSISPGILPPPPGSSPGPGQPRQQQQSQPQQQTGTPNLKSTIMSLYGGPPPQQAATSPQQQPSQPLGSFASHEQQQGQQAFYSQQGQQQGQQQSQLQFQNQGQFQASQQPQQPSPNQYFAGTGYQQQTWQGAQPQSQYGAYVGAASQDGGGFSMPASPGGTSVYGAVPPQALTNPWANNSGLQQNTPTGPTSSTLQSNHTSDPFGALADFGK